jgi:cytochrome c oxidase subunit 2
MKRLATIIVLACSGCTGFDNQSPLHPSGVQADDINRLYLLNFWVCAVVYMLVVSAVVWALVRRTRCGPALGVDHTTDTDRRAGLIVSGLVILTAAILTVFLIADFLTGRAIDSRSDADAPTIKVTGHQWWWEVRYESPDPSQVFTTANEIHIPVGRVVRIELESADVIHSFWVPNLHGKTDMIPGHPTRTFVKADRPDIYWGQCAEFCGQQHANMRFQVVAESADDFERWKAAQLQPAPEPKTASQKHGQQVFLTRTCVMCHTIGGTKAQARLGPPLTHVASRQRIAAGTLPNTRGNLAGWIGDPHGVKPGVRMIVNPLPSNELQDLLDYLETLK